MFHKIFGLKVGSSLTELNPSSYSSSLPPAKFSIPYIYKKKQTKWIAGNIIEGEGFISGGGGYSDPLRRQSMTHNTGYHPHIGTIIGVYLGII